MPEQTGKILEIFDEVEVTPTTVRRDFIIEENGKYKNKICFSLLNTRTDLIDPYSVGDSIKVHYNLQSREHNTRWYTQATAWKLEPST